MVATPFVLSHERLRKWRALWVAELNKSKAQRNLAGHADLLFRFQVTWNGAIVRSGHSHCFFLQSVNPQLTAASCYPLAGEKNQHFPFSLVMSETRWVLSGPNISSLAEISEWNRNAHCWLYNARWNAAETSLLFKSSGTKEQEP